MLELHELFGMLLQVVYLLLSLLFKILLIDQVHAYYQKLID